MYSLQNSFISHNGYNNYGPHTEYINEPAKPGRESGCWFPFGEDTANKNKDLVYGIGPRVHGFGKHSTTAARESSEPFD